MYLCSSPKVVTAKICESDRLFCLISVCMFGSFNNPFATVTSLSEFRPPRPPSFSFFPKNLLILANFLLFLLKLLKNKLFTVTILVSESYCKV